MVLGPVQLIHASVTLRQSLLRARRNSDNRELLNPVASSEPPESFDGHLAGASNEPQEFCSLHVIELV